MIFTILFCITRFQVSHLLSITRYATSVVLNIKADSVASWPLPFIYNKNLCKFCKQINFTTIEVTNCYWYIKKYDISSWPIWESIKTCQINYYENNWKKRSKVTYNQDLSAHVLFILVMINFFFKKTCAIKMTLSKKLGTTTFATTYLSGEL